MSTTRIWMLQSKLHINKISVFQGNFMEGETEYFQVSNSKLDLVEAPRNYSSSSS